jgi:DNA helicase-2/ATP-dependent DNA helicase PcrA
MYLKTMYEMQEAQERLENLKELMNALHYFASQGKETIEKALDEISLLQEKADKDAQKDPGITLMTLHAAKGLEFDTVIIPGLEEGLFPSTRTTYDLNEIEEERRLFYVGITRAREKLLITHSRHRQMYGKMEESSPSRFLKELPSTCIKHDAASTWHHQEASQYFSQWFGYSKSDAFASSSHTVTIYAQPKSFVEKSPTDSSSFKKHQTVKHPIFGIGIVCEIEKKEYKTFVTAQFKIGLKKIDSTFLSLV